MGTTALLARESLSRWARPAGLVMLLAVALVPPALTAAWVFTHDADLAVTALTWEPRSPTEGELANVSATVQNRFDDRAPSVNVTVRVGYYTQDLSGTVRWTDAANRTFSVGPLGPRAAETVTMNWTTQPGIWQVEAWVDRWPGEVREVEKLNNFRPGQIQVQYAPLRPEIPPPPGSNQTEAGLPQADLEVVNVTLQPEELHEQDNATYRVEVRNLGPAAVSNGTLRLQVYRLTATGGIGLPLLDESQAVNLTGGQATNLSFEQRNLARARYALAAFSDPGAAARDANRSNDALVRQFDVERRLVFEEPDEGATAREFYRSQVLLPLHFTLLVPLIALFYAGSVLEDDRNRGNLPYLLTRPVPRWALPLARFSSSFLVALAAVAAGILLTFLVLLATPRADVGYLWWPLLFGTLVLFLYGGAASFVGVVAERPYLVGLLYVLGFESLVLAGRRVILNDQPIVQDWVLQFSLSHWVGKAFGGWDPAQGFQWLPDDGGALKALGVMVAVGAAGLLGSAWVMGRREFHE